MDPTKPSLPSKAPYVNNEGGHESPLEEGPVQNQDTVNGETENKETDVVDGTTVAAEKAQHHRGSADKHKFGTLGYQRRTKQKTVSDFATVGKGISGGGKPRAALRQSLFSQGGSEKSLPSEERGQLDGLKQALQAYAVPVSLKWSWNKENQGTVLEKNWTDIVHSHLNLSKTQRHQQEALWEFVHTELTYINKLLIIRDLVIAALVNLRRNGFLPEVTPEQLFSNLPDILSAHQLFWQEVIYPMLHEVRRTGQLFDPLMLEAGCQQFQQRFSSYKLYCWEEDNNLEFTRRQMENNPHFQTYVQWVETHPQCDRMRLGDMQAKPHQRITKYPLLLKAVLTFTQDHSAQQSLKVMLSSVNWFLESINDYLRLKDEELALSISAQRVEGYDVQGINEEIDKHLKEMSQFDLTCPISGVGPNVVRKLLLEENLKLRGRKDSKLEVVALLFSDVLLMTKAQKKGERLKMVRPPLALDRTHCVALKDGCSFVLVEMGELQCAVTVYTFTTSSSDTCSKWISTIQLAKETLESQRETEAKNQQDKFQQLEDKLVQEAEEEDTETEMDSFTDSEKINFEFALDDQFILHHSMNGISETTGAGDVSPPHDVGNEWIKKGRRGDQREDETEEEEKIVESQMTKEQWVSFNHSNNTARPKTIQMEELPDVDYPTDEDNTLQPSNQPATFLKPRPHELPVKTMSTRRNSDSVSVKRKTRRNASYSEPEDMETFNESWGLSKKRKSPKIRRKRPVSTVQGPLAHMSNKDSAKTFAASHNNSSSSNNGSDRSLNIRKNSGPPGQSSDSHRVLKLGSLKPNTDMFWNTHDGRSPDSKAISESEPSGLNKKPDMNNQRSAFVPNASTERGQKLRLPSSDLSTSPNEYNKKPTTPVNNVNESPSILEGLLVRAKDRERERNGFKNDTNSFYSSVYTTPSPSPSPSPRGTEWGENEVKLTRHRAPTVSERWKEQLVDEDDDERRNSVFFVDGENVDWPGWCFDDDEVMSRLGGQGLLEDISRSLNFMNVHEYSEHEYGEVSQV